jgi:preprotein translocase subunit SecF
LLAALNIDEQAPQVERLNTVGPSIGKEVRSKAFLAIALVVVAIILYIAFVFRKVSPGIEEDAEKIPSSWKYGFIAILALLHDIAIPIGVFALFQIEISSLFVVGLLSILGLSVNDTIVVFDRIRENLTTNKEEKTKESFAATVGRALRQTMARSINTSLTLLIVLGALLAVGPVAIQELALVLLIGTFVGTYSSIFIASPLLVLWNKNT